MSKSNIKTVEKQFANADFIPEIIKLLDEGHTVTLLLRGYSMRPFLEDTRQGTADKAQEADNRHARIGGSGREAIRAAPHSED